MRGEAKLDRATKDSLQIYLSLAALDTIRRIYSKPGIMDGMVIGFYVNRGGTELKTQVENLWVFPLREIAEFVSRRLSPEHRLILETPEYSREN